MSMESMGLHRMLRVLMEHGERSEHGYAQGAQCAQGTI